MRNRIVSGYEADHQINREGNGQHELEDFAGRPEEQLALFAPLVEWCAPL